jgi:hypothetical protein
MLLLWRAAIDGGPVQVGGDLIHLVTWPQGAVTPWTWTIEKQKGQTKLYKVYRWPPACGG